VTTVLLPAAEMSRVTADAIRPWLDTVTSIGLDIADGSCLPPADCLPAVAVLAAAFVFTASLRLARSLVRISDATSLCTCNFLFSIRSRASANLVFCRSFCLASKVWLECWPESFRRASNLLSGGFAGCGIAAANSLEDPLYAFLDPPGACCLCPSRARTLHKHQMLNTYHSTKQL